MTESSCAMSQVVETMVPMHTAAHAVFEVPREVKVALDTQHPNVIRTYQHGARVLRGYRDQVCLNGPSLLYNLCCQQILAMSVHQ